MGIMTYSQFELCLRLVGGDGEGDGVPQEGGAVGRDAAGKVVVLLRHGDVALDQQQETLHCLQTRLPGYDNSPKRRWGVTTPQPIMIFMTTETLLDKPELTCCLCGITKPTDVCLRDTPEMRTPP